MNFYVSWSTFAPGCFGLTFLSQISVDFPTFLISYPYCFCDFLLLLMGVCMCVYLSLCLSLSLKQEQSSGWKVFNASSGLRIVLTEPYPLSQSILIHYSDLHVLVDFFPPFHVSVGCCKFHCIGGLLFLVVCVFFRAKKLNLNLLAMCCIGKRWVLQMVQGKFLSFVTGFCLSMVSVIVLSISLVQTLNWALRIHYGTLIHNSEYMRLYFWSNKSLID